MASAAVIASLRLLIAEPTEETYTDAVLSQRLDDVAEDVNAVAAAIWQEKAAAYNGLVDMSEGNSSRKLSQLQDQALKMAASFRSQTTTTTSDGGARRFARSRPIDRV
jgi:hypothetical protein